MSHARSRGTSQCSSCTCPCLLQKKKVHLAFAFIWGSWNPETMFEALVTTMLRAPELMGKRQQRQDALDFCTSHLHTEMEARHCLGVLMAPNSDGPVKYGED